MSFPFDDVRVLAVQYAESSSLGDDLPPDVWIIVGRRALLPGGLPLTATWGELVRRYGEHIGSQEDQVIVMFCRMPTFFFTLGVVPRGGGSITDWSAIPDSTTIEELRLYSIPPANWSC